MYFFTKLLFVWWPVLHQIELNNFSIELYDIVKINHLLFAAVKVRWQTELTTVTVIHCYPILTGRNTMHDPGDREHATALYMACRHLPTPLLSSPGERAGMLVEAARTLERIGDKKRLQDCYTLMKAMGTSISTWFLFIRFVFCIPVQSNLYIP